MKIICICGKNYTPRPGIETSSSGKPYQFSAIWAISVTHRLNTHQQRNKKLGWGLWTCWYIYCMECFLTFLLMLKDIWCDILFVYFNIFLFFFLANFPPNITGDSTLFSVMNEEVKVQYQTEDNDVNVRFTLVTNSTDINITGEEIITSLIHIDFFSRFWIKIIQIINGDNVLILNFYIDCFPLTYERSRGKHKKLKFWSLSDERKIPLFSLLYRKWCIDLASHIHWTNVCYCGGK